MKTRSSAARMLRASIAIWAIALTLTGCKNLMYKSMGDTMQGFSRDHTIPYMLSSDDVAVGCTMSEAMSPMLLSFGRVTNEPDQLAVMMYMSAGGCEEQRAWEHEFRYMRAISQQNPDEAEDALIAAKRHQLNAARRQFEAWKRLSKHYGEPGGAECPELDEDFDQFIWMVGLMAGLQSLNNEVQSTMTVGVPKNIASKVERGASCLDDDQWWGVPMAMRAAVWALLPGAEPQGENAWERLDAADKKGERARVRLAHVMHAMAAYSKGDMERVKNVIRKHAKAIKKRPSRPSDRLIDKLATHNLLALSDRMWTQNTGHRTPVGGFGTFWDDKRESDVEAVELDDLL